MASKKKESEGIALLSMYNDEDEEMEDTYEEDEDADPHNKEELGKSDRAVSDSANELTPASVDPFQSSAPVEYLSPPEIDRVPTPIATPNPSPTPPPVLVPQFRSSSPPQQLQPPPSPPPAQPPVMESQRMRRQVLTIVDYAHDETAMSPEAEEGEITSSGHVMFGGDLQTINGNSQEITSGAVQNFTPNSDSMIQRPSEQSEPSQSENTTTMTYAKMESESTGMEETLVVEVEMKEDVDPLDEFLPPAPTTKCSEELQEKINKFLALKKSGKSFNAEVRNRKDYRNPDFLLHAVRYQDIDQIGSCFSKAVFDPHGYDKSDFYVEIELNMKHEMERKEQEKKKSQKVDFVAGGTQPGMLSGAPKTGMQIPVIPNIAATGHHSLSSTADVMMRDSRMSKKSKWDKVDSDRQNPLQTGGQDVISAAATHAVFLSAASAGAGYTAFAQQKRREAEEKRSSDKRRS